MNKISKRLLSLLLTLIMVLTSTGLSTVISAATILDIGNNSNQKLYVSWYSYNYDFGGRLNTNTYGQIIKLNVGSANGQVAYCIQSSRDAYTSDYIAQEYYDLLTLTQQKNIKHALIYSYQGAVKYGTTADIERLLLHLAKLPHLPLQIHQSETYTLLKSIRTTQQTSLLEQNLLFTNLIRQHLLASSQKPQQANIS